MILALASHWPVVIAGIRTYRSMQSAMNQALPTVEHHTGNRTSIDVQLLLRVPIGGARATAVRKERTMASRTAACSIGTGPCLVSKRGLVGRC
jgi:hypothetical protein